jgi:hypothetical protein
MTDQQGKKIAQEIGYHLNKTYPGHIWMINVDGGLITVKNNFLSALMGFTLKLTDLDIGMHKITMAGGEILERYRIRRDGPLKFEDLTSKPRDFAGRFHFDG